MTKNRNKFQRRGAREEIWWPRPFLFKEPMIKKILSASLIILHLLTQSASAFEYLPIIQPIAIQPLQITSDILKNKMSFSGVNDFLFFKISDSFVNQPLAFGQGLSVFSNVSANQTLSNPAGWRLTGAYLHNPSQAIIKMKPLVVTLTQKKRIRIFRFEF